MSTTDTQQTPVYNTAYFRAKFEAIPDSLWLCGTYGHFESHCALGHCGIRHKGQESTDTPEGKALRELFRGYFPVHEVNDGVSEDIRLLFPQRHPKRRILAALKHIEEYSLLQQSKPVAE